MTPGSESGANHEVPCPGCGKVGIFADDYYDLRPGSYRECGGCGKEVVVTSVDTVMYLEVKLR